MSASTVVLLVSLLLLAVTIAFTVFELRRTARETVREFKRRFPGRCFICFSHEHGYAMGYEKSPTPPPHECIGIRVVLYDKKAEVERTRGGSR